VAALTGVRLMAHGRAGRGRHSGGHRGTPPQSGRRVAGVGARSRVRLGDRDTPGADDDLAPPRSGVAGMQPADHHALQPDQRVVAQHGRDLLRDITR
jgi:hypothetical protein